MGAGAGGISVSWLPPAGTFCICLQHSSIALAVAAALVVVVVVVASRPVRCVSPWRGPPGTHCFDFYPQREYANLQASTGPGLSWPGLVVTRRATSPQAPIVLAEFSQQRLAASKPFWPNVFFFWPVAEPIKHAAAPHFSSCFPQLMIRFSA